MIDLGLVAEAQHEVGEPEVRVVLHHVPEDRPVADRDHRLGHHVGCLAHPQPLAAAEDDDLHRTCTSGIGTTNCAPHSRACGELLHDLLLEVPGQDQDVVGAVLLERLGVLDRDVRAREELALLVRVAVDRVLEEVGADAAEVQERVALPGRAVAGDALALAAARDEELEQAPFGLVDLGGERAVRLERVEAQGALALGELRRRGR